VVSDEFGTETDVGDDEEDDATDEADDVEASSICADLVDEPGEELLSTCVFTSAAAEPATSTPVSDKIVAIRAFMSSPSL
jgi:hypothetical protein